MQNFSERAYWLKLFFASLTHTEKTLNWSNMLNDFQILILACVSAQNGACEIRTKYRI